jgi:hypothetical protein
MKTFRNLQSPNSQFVDFKSSDSGATNSQATHGNSTNRCCRTQGDCPQRQRGEYRQSSAFRREFTHWSGGFGGDRIPSAAPPDLFVIPLFHTLLPGALYSLPSCALYFKADAAEPLGGRAAIKGFAWANRAGVGALRGQGASSHNLGSSSWRGA